MSRETLQHLNTNTLIGFTEHRGHAWHYRAEEQGDEPNHYPGAIPTMLWAVAEDRQGIGRSDTRAVMGIRVQETITTPKVWRSGRT